MVLVHTIFFFYTFVCMKISAEQFWDHSQFFTWPNAHNAYLTISRKYQTSATVFCILYKGMAVTDTLYIGSYVLSDVNPCNPILWLKRHPSESWCFYNIWFGMITCCSLCVVLAVPVAQKLNAGSLCFRRHMCGCHSQWKRA